MSICGFLHSRFKRLRGILCGYLLFGRIDIYIDPSFLQVADCRYMQVGQNFFAEKFLWLNAVTSYGGQRFTPKILIGDNVHINHFVHIGCIEYVEIGNNVLFGSKVYISDHNHGNYTGGNQSELLEPPIQRALSSKPVIVEDNVWLGDNVVVLPGVHIGAGAIIGANSVVTHDIPAATIAVGSPARPIKRWDEEKHAWVRTDS